MPEAYSIEQSQGTHRILGQQQFAAAPRTHRAPSGAVKASNGSAAVGGGLGQQATLEAAASQQ